MLRRVRTVLIRTVALVALAPKLARSKFIRLHTASKGSHSTAKSLTSGGTKWVMFHAQPISMVLLSK